MNALFSTPPLPPLAPPTCRELQPPVDRHAGPFTLADVHGELQAARLPEHTVGEGEVHFIGAAADQLGGVDQQLVQDVLVGKGGALREHPAVLQRLGVELAPADFACGDERQCVSVRERERG